MWEEMGLASFFANRRSFARDHDAGADAAKTRLIYVGLHILAAACKKPEYMQMTPETILELSNQVQDARGNVTTNHGDDSRNAIARPPPREPSTESSVKVPEYVTAYVKGYYGIRATEPDRIDEGLLEQGQ